MNFDKHKMIADVSGTNIHGRISAEAMILKNIPLADAISASLDDVLHAKDRSLMITQHRLNTDLWYCELLQALKARVRWCAVCTGAGAGGGRQALWITGHRQQREGGPGARDPPLRRPPPAAPAGEPGMLPPTPAGWLTCSQYCTTFHHLRNIRWPI